MNIFLTVYRTVKAILCMCYFAIVTCVVAIGILLIYAVSWLLPVSLRNKIMTWLGRVPGLWSICVLPAMLWLGVRHWQIDLPASLTADHMYLVMSNHQSWADILILYYVFNRRAAHLKFFMKKELVWQLPFAGLACKAMGFPMLSRHSKAAIKKNPALKNKDKASTKKACEHVKQHPASLMIFPEGSRFKRSKHKRQNSPYDCLLKPKAGGVAMSLNGVGEALQGVVDVSIDYGAGKRTLSFWKFLEGRYRSIKVIAELLPITADLVGDYDDDKAYRKVIQNWLSDRWAAKDAWLAKERVHGK